MAGWVRLLGFFRQNIFYSSLLNLYTQIYLLSNYLSKTYANFTEKEKNHLSRLK